MAADQQFCYIKYPDGMAHNTMARSLFEAAANALHWSEESCKSFGTARRFGDDEILEITVGRHDAQRYLVRVGRVRKWTAEQIGSAGQ